MERLPISRLRIRQIEDLCWIRISFQRIISKVLFYRSSTLLGYLLPCTVIVGGFFGDEGKGKIAAYLATKDKPDLCVRGGDGPNAGHTVVHGGEQYSRMRMPTGSVKAETGAPTVHG